MIRSREGGGIQEKSLHPGIVFILLKAGKAAGTNCSTAGTVTLQESLNFLTLDEIFFLYICFFLVSVKDLRRSWICSLYGF